MNNPFLQAISDYDLIRRGDSITVALSGGADSVSLLHMLAQIREEYALTLTAAHINHMIRGGEAFYDEQFCIDLCRKLDVELFVKRADIPALSRQQKISGELCGRNVRYEFFAEISKRLDSKVATAHTLSDSAETLIFNLTRGASLGGLRSIPPKRDFIIRPLILCTRDYVESYCRENGLEYVTDSTNLCDDYTRNKIRRNVIPALKEINPQLENAAKRLCDDVRDVCVYLDKQTKTALEACKTEFGWNAKGLLSLDRAIRRNAISEICKLSGTNQPENVHIALIDGMLKTGGAVDVCGSYRAVISQDILRIVRIENDLISDVQTGISDFINKEYEFFGKKYSFTEINKIEFSDNELSSCIVNADCKDNMVLRTRREGDKFTFYDRKITKPLRKAMNEMKLPSELRDKTLVLAVGNTVLWCENIGVSLQGRCDFDAENAIRIKIV